jgi:hypothetical protein
MAPMRAASLVQHAGHAQGSGAALAKAASWLSASGHFEIADKMRMRLWHRADARFGRRAERTISCVAGASAAEMCTCQHVRVLAQMSRPTSELAAAELVGLTGSWPNISED